MGLSVPPLSMSAFWDCLFVRLLDGLIAGASYCPSDSCIVDSCFCGHFPACDAEVVRVG